MNSKKVKSDDTRVNDVRITIPFECSTVDDENFYDSDEDFYDNYEPDEEIFFDNGEYEPFNPEEEKEHQAYVSPKLIKKIRPVWTSPNKKAEINEKKSPTPTWWDKNEVVPEVKRVINGVLNYAALLPAPTLKVVQQPKKSKKSKKNETTATFVPSLSGKNRSTTTLRLRPEIAEKPKKNVTATSVPVSNVEKSQFQQKPIKPTRFCLSVIKKTKCFHGQCRFAHDYSELKECNFGENCKKIMVLKTNQDGTFELANKNNNVICNFKHSKESKNSYLKRIPQQSTSPKK